MPESDSGRVEKTLDEDLRRLVATGEAEPISIIVELDLPSPRVQMGSDRRSGGVGRGAQRVVPAEEDRRKSEQIVEEVGGFLEKASGRPPVWLSASRAFVVDVTTDQLETIARSPHVRRISRNERRWP